MTRPITNPINPASLQQPVRCWTGRPVDFPARITAAVGTSGALYNMYQKICNFCAARFLELRIVFRSIWTIASSTAAEMQTQIGDLEGFRKMINECENTGIQKIELLGAYLQLSEKLQRKFVGVTDDKLRLFITEIDPEKAQETKERFLNECSLLMSMHKLLIPIRNLFSRFDKNDTITPPPSPRPAPLIVPLRPPVEPLFVEEAEESGPTPIVDPIFMDEPEVSEEPNSPIYYTWELEEAVELPPTAEKPVPVQDKPAQSSIVKEPGTVKKPDSAMVFAPAISSLDEFEMLGVGVVAEAIRKLGRNIAAMGNFVADDCFDCSDDPATRAIKEAEYTPEAQALRDKYQCASKKDGIPMTIPTFHRETYEKDSQEPRQDIDIMKSQLEKDENLMHPQYHGRKCALCNAYLNKTNVKIDVKLQKVIAQQLGAYISKMTDKEIVKRFERLAIELGEEVRKTVPLFSWEAPDTYMYTLSKFELKAKIADIIKNLPDCSVNGINIHDKIRGCYETNINQILK
jgi:hypothetical protein